ncbi:MAG: ABC transporter permease [Bdellovibrionales bacterium]|nr:ABC transporter permease [Bdellovibrionales bacterium]
MASLKIWLIRLRPIIAALLGLSLGIGITALAGESPAHVVAVLVKSALGSPYDLGMTLFYTTPLVFTGLSVAMAFQCGLFNIGAEGQLAMGALWAAVLGIVMPGLPGFVAPVFAVLACILGGAAWGAIPGWLRAKRGSHEVINTIMMNFVSAGVCSYVTLYVFRNTEGQNPETLPIAAAYQLSQFSSFGGAPVSWALILAVLVWAGCIVFLRKTRLGFQLMSVGENESAAEASGISSPKMRILAMAIAGGLAGLVGVGEVLGNAHKFKMGFSADFGFIGIAVALLARGRPEGVLPSAFLFGALHKGTADLDFETTHVTRELALILQALVILSVSADGLWDWMNRIGVKKRTGKAAS